MIELAPDTAFLAYLATTLTVLLGFWVNHLYSAKKRKLVFDEQTLTVCEYCHCGYLATTGDQISRCPQCKSLNKMK